MTDSSGSWLSNLRGRFVVFDGIDGSGKTTQFQRFTEFLQRCDLEVCQVREPGGTAIGEQVRQILLDPANGDMDLLCEMLLYMASRAQLVARQIRPALEANRIVLADRFISSTLAYQGAAGGIPVPDILQVGRIALGPCWPDLVVIFDVELKTALSRLSRQLDRVERRSAEFHRAVRNGFLEQARTDPKRHLVIDANVDTDAVFDRLVIEIRDKLGEDER